jgi:hypothetical protein
MIVEKLLDKTEILAGVEMIVEKLLDKTEILAG